MKVIENFHQSLLTTWSLCMTQCLIQNGSLGEAFLAVPFSANTTVRQRVLIPDADHLISYSRHP